MRKGVSSMKTNSKRVINIILALAMMISLITALSGVALAAAPALDGVASYDKEVITVKISGAGSSAFASLRVLNTEDNSIIFVDQVTLNVGETVILIPVDDVAVRGNYVDIIVASSIGTVVMKLTVGKAVSLRIDAPASYAVKVNTKINLFSLIAKDEKGEDAFLGRVKWTVTSELMAKVNADNTISILNKTGTAVLSAYDVYSGLTYTIILRIT